MTHKSEEDPTIVETLRKLQSRVQVWVKPTDRILTDADAYEYDLYQAEKTSGKVSFQWGLSLSIFGILAGSLTYYTCWLLVSGKLATLDKGWGGWLFEHDDVGGLFSALVFHLCAFPAFSMMKGNKKVKKICGEIVGYCLLALVLSAVWSSVLFGGKSPGRVVFVDFRPFKVAYATI
ncbi:hypothetical protein TWF481_001702 [Arthrobotrys musiformis]|uniref:Amino acid transporter transmembrane domain-containing protein n=1 Tax=Arthrobotrys musiformis TaxID=47236 RepID=A0AAV9VW14_9PEZI